MAVFTPHAAALQKHYIAHTRSVHQTKCLHGVDPSLYLSHVFSPFPADEVSFTGCCISPTGASLSAVLLFYTAQTLHSDPIIHQNARFVFISIHLIYTKAKTPTTPPSPRVLRSDYICAWQVLEITSICCSLVRSINLTA